MRFRELGRQPGSKTANKHCRRNPRHKAGIGGSIRESQRDSILRTHENRAAQGRAATACHVNQVMAHASGPAVSTRRRVVSGPIPSAITATPATAKIRSLAASAESTVAAIAPISSSATTAKVSPITAVAAAIFGVPTATAIKAADCARSSFAVHWSGTITAVATIIGAAQATGGTRSGVAHLAIGRGTSAATARRPVTRRAIAQRKVPSEPSSPVWSHRTWPRQPKPAAKKVPKAESLESSAYEGKTELQDNGESKRHTIGARIHGDGLRQDGTHAKRAGCFLFLRLKAFPRADEIYGGDVRVLFIEDEPNPTALRQEGYAEERLRRKCRDTPEFMQVLLRRAAGMAQSMVEIGGVRIALPARTLGRDFNLSHRGMGYVLP